MHPFILRYKIFIAINAKGLKTTAALKEAGLAASFTNLTRNEEDMNPRLINLVVLCRVLSIYPSDLFHPNMDKWNTKSTPHSPRPELKDFIIIEDDLSQAFLELLDKKKFVTRYRYETYYGLTGRKGWKRRSPTLIMAKDYLGLMGITIYEFFLHVEKIAKARIKRGKNKETENS